jgi:hypothetical protein
MGVFSFGDIFTRLQNIICFARWLNLPLLAPEFFNIRAKTEWFCPRSFHQFEIKQLTQIIQVTLITV